MSPLKFRSTRAQRDVDAINAAEEVKLIFSAGDDRRACVKQRGIQEDNIIVARDSQSGRRAC
jgi:hypothetical protein